jgi:DNA-directed RNA polymerase specialized sigma24 family protein
VPDPAQRVAARIRALMDAAGRHEAAAGRARTERDAAVLALRVQHGWSLGRIARETGLTKGHVAVICRPAARRELMGGVPGNRLTGN